MQKTNVKAIVEAGAMSSVTVIAGLISAIIPVFFPLIPVPITLLGMRQGVKWSVMASIVAGLIISMMTDPIRGFKVMTFCLIGIVLGHALRNNYTPGKVVLWGSAAAVVGLGSYALLTALLLGINPFAIDVDALNNTLGQVVSFYRSHGVEEQQLVQIEEAGLNVIKLMKLIVPTSFVAGALLLAIINYYAARLILKRLGQPLPGFPPFKQWTMPRYVLYLFIIGILATYWGERQGIEWLFFCGGNLQYAGFFLTFVQGLAVFYYLADKYNLSRFVRGIILLLIFVNNIFSFAVIYAGAFDLALDWRKLRTPHSS